MAIYRPDQAQLSFGAEGVQGADAELLDAQLGSVHADVNGAISAGDSTVTYGGSSGTFEVGDFVRIGEAITGSGDAVDAATALPYEIRRVEYVTSTVLHLDRPCAFDHANNSIIKETTALAPVTGTVSDGGGDDTDISVPSLRFVPGAYTAVTVPDMTPTLEPKYFLGNTAKRNMTTMYAGQQSFTGSLPGVTILNGWMLRFGIGSVRSTISTGLTTAADWTLGTLLLNSAASKGAMMLKVTGAGATISTSDISAGDIIELHDNTTRISGTGTTQTGAATLTDTAATFATSGVVAGSTVLNLTDGSRGIVASTSETVITFDADGMVGGTGSGWDTDDVYSIVVPTTIVGTYKVQRVVADPVTTIVLETPLKEAYSASSVLILLTGGAATTDTFTHVIQEQNELDTLSWHLRMLDSGEGNPFIRRSIGGMVDSSTLSASEGEMLQASWDSVHFMGTIHNLEDQATVGTSLYASSASAAGLPGFALMDDIVDTDIDFPNTEPYYFSQGAVYIGGEGGTRQEFARIRDFNLAITNSVEPRYYVSSRHGNGRRKGPNEMREGRREYTFSATVALPDSEATTAIGLGSALELYKQLLLEGDYGSGSQGFNIRLEFIRGTNDTMVIDLPGDATAATGIGEGGVWLRGASLPIGEDPMLQTAIDCVARNLKITIVDNEPVYP